MRRLEQSSMGFGESRVVHWVGQVTDEVFSFLGPATTALSESQLSQTVVAFDSDSCRRLLPRFHEAIELILVPATSNPVIRWARAASVMREVIRREPVKAVHLHGFMPGIAGSMVGPLLDRGVHVYYSPHGSKSLGSLRTVGSAMRLVLRPLFGWPAQKMIANMAAEARTLTQMTRQSVDLVESPVPQAFFNSEAHQAHLPLIVTGSRAPNPRAAEMMAQLAVLLSDKSLNLSFNWLGPADAPSAQRLRAANIQLYDASDEEERASRLASGWVYLAAGGTRGFPISLVEAMAVGLPCVALDTDYHRDLIRHGETGFLFKSQDEALHCIAQLVDSQRLRQAVGEAGQREAGERFSSELFRDSLFSAYEAVVI